MATFTYINLDGISTTTSIFKTAVTGASNYSTITLDAEYSFKPEDATTETSESKTLTIEGARIQTDKNNNVTISGPWDLTYKTVSQLKGKESGKITFSGGARITIYETNHNYGYAVCNMQGNANLELTDHSTLLVKPHYNSNNEFHEGYFLNESGGTVSVAGKSRFLADRMNSNGTNTTISVTDNSLFQIGTFDNSGNFTGGALTNGSALTVTSSTFVAGSVSNSGTSTLTDSVATIGNVSSISGDVLLSNTGTVSVSATDASTGILRLTGLDLDDGYYTVTVTPAGEDTPVSGFGGISLPVAGGALSISGAFTAGTAYTVSIADTAYAAADVTAASCSLTVWGKATNSKRMNITGGVLLDVKNNFANNNQNSVFTVEDSTFRAGSFSNSNAAAAANFTNSVLTVSGAITNSGTISMTGTDVTVGDTSSVSTEILLTNNGTINLVKSSDAGSFTVYGKGKNSKTLTVSGGAVFDVKHDFNNEAAASVLTVTDSTFRAGWFRNSNSSATANFTNSVVIVSGTASNSGTATFTDVLMSVGAETDATPALTNGSSASRFHLTSTGASDSTLTVDGELKNVGTLTVKTAAMSVAVTPPVSDTTVSVEVRDSSSNVVYSNAAFAVSEGASAISIFADSLKAGETYSVSIDGGESADYEAFTTTASITVDGKVTNTNSNTVPAVISVDAWSTFSANTFVNKYGEFRFVYNPDFANVSISSFNNASGTITIDITEYLNNRAEKPIVTISGITISKPSEQGTIRFVRDDGTGTPVDVTDVFYSLNTNNEIVLGPKMIFVNAKWAEGADGHVDTPASITYNGKTYTVGVDADAYGNLQEAIRNAADWATIVFFNGDSAIVDVNDFKFYTQGLITVDRNLFFESDVTTKAVKLDSLKINTGCTAEFRTGLYSLEDFLDNEGTLKVVNNTRFNSDLVKNATGTITLDKTSRLVAASIDAGNVELRAGFVYNDFKWIEHPYAAKIGDNVTIRLVYPKTSFSPSDAQEGVFYETRTIEGTECQVVVETITPGDQVFVKVDGDGNYICYGTAAHHGGETPAAPGPGEEAWGSFYAATEYGGLQLIDDEFDLNDPDGDGIYETAAIYVNNSAGFRTARFTTTRDSSSKLSVSDTSLAVGGYNCTVAVGDNVLTGTLTVTADKTTGIRSGSVVFRSGSLPSPGETPYVIVLADPKYMATASSGSLTLTGTGLAAGAYRYSITTEDAVLTGDCSVTVVEDVNSVIITDAGLVDGTNYTVTLTDASRSTFTANSQSLDDADHSVSVSTEFNDYPVVYDSFMGALNSVYIKGHTIGTDEPGMIIRLQGGTYREGDFSAGDAGGSTRQLEIGTNYNIIVEPDRYWDVENEQWQYDSVSLILGGTVGQPDTANLMTFYKLKNLTIDNWVLGRDRKQAENSVINFVDIEDLVINVRMKPQGAATVRILNSNVTSKTHFSVPGSTLIVENSYVKLVGATGDGALSTENNYVGSGTVIVRNSVFELKDASANDLIFNLKVNSEFTISGTCTVNGIFTNLQPEKGTDTYISFRDAILDENTNIQAGENDTGAALRFEGYNVLDGSTVVQKGNQDMTIESGSTLDMSGGASIEVGGGVDVSNCGNISLDNASISAGSFTNEGSLTLSDGSEINLVHDQNQNGNGELTMEVIFDEFFYNKTVRLTVTEPDDTPVIVRDNDDSLGLDDSYVKVLKRTVGGQDEYYAVIKRKDENSFDSEIEYTITHDGYFVNSENGTLTVELQSDGSLGISKGDGTPVDIDNSGTIYIDLSKTDIPEDPYIVLDGLSGTGEVVVIGGGGEYANTPLPGGGSNVPHINLFTPSTGTLYVNDEWSDESFYKKGKNVGSYTYFGYNAFADNRDGDPDTNRDLEFAADTTKVIYYGGNAAAPYRAWTLPRVVKTITTEAGVFARYSGSDTTKNEVKYYAWRKGTGDSAVYLYTDTLDIVKGADPTQAYTWNGESFDAGTDVADFALLDSITLTTMGSMSSAKMTIGRIVIAAGSTRHVALEVRDANRKLVEKQSISVTASESETILENVVFYSSKLSEADAGGYTVSINDNGSATQIDESYWSVDDITGDRDTATMGPMTVDAGQTVTISGATMNMQDDGATDSIMNSGTLKIQTGESAKLVIPVALSASMRDVKVVVKIGTNEEYHTVQAAAGETTVTVESKSFAPGQEYTISGTDTQQCSAADNTVVVPVAAGDARMIDVVVRNADGVKFSFTNVSVGAGDTAVSLNPALDNTGAAVSGDPNHFTVENNDGLLTLTVTGEVEAQKVDVYVQKTVGDTVYRFDYTFNVAAHADGASAATYTQSTRLSSAGYYYVEAVEPDITVTAEVNGISGAYVAAQDVTNSGTLSVSSQEDVARLDLTVGHGPENRMVQVTVLNDGFAVGTFDIEVAASASDQQYTILSSNLLAGKTYAAMVTDTLYRTGLSTSGSGSAPKLTFALPDAGDTVQVQVTKSETGDIIGTYTATRITNNESPNDDIYTVVSGEFEAETKYTVTATISEETVSRTVDSSTAAEGSALKLAFSVEAGDARTVTAVVKDGDGTVVGTFDIEVASSASATECTIVSSEFRDSKTYTVSLAGENSYSAVIANDSKAIAAAPRKVAKLVLDVDRNDNASRWIEVVTGGNTYSLFVEKDARTAELKSENFAVGTEYADVRIRDTYSFVQAAAAGAGEGAAPTLTLTGLSSSDNIIRPDGNLQRTLHVTVRDGAVTVATVTIPDSAISDEGEAIIGISGLTAGKEYTVELSDEKTVVATAETLAVFNSTGDVVNGTGKTIDITDATFIAGTLTNHGLITISNSQLMVGSTDEYGVFHGDVLMNGQEAAGSITLYVDSLIMAGSIANPGTITIDATSFDPATTDMKKVIDLDEEGALTGDGALILDPGERTGIGILYDAIGHDYWVIAADQSTVYVNAAWATDENGLAHETGDHIEDETVGGKKLYYGYNAFSSFTDAYAETLRSRFCTLDAEGKNPVAQTIEKIEVFGTAEEAEISTMQGGKTVADLVIDVHGSSPASAVIPFADGVGLTLIPANGETITIEDGVTIRTTGAGSVLNLGGDADTTTTGTVVIEGAVDSEGAVVVYGLTEVGGAVLKAASLDVTADDLLTVSGVSTLNIGSLDGSAIRLLDGTELVASSVSGGLIDSAYDFTFSGATSLTGGVSVTATGKTVTNTGALTVDWQSRITAESLDNNTTPAATITVDADTFDSTDTTHVTDGFATVIDVSEKDGSLTLSKISLKEGAPAGVSLVQKLNGDICVGITDQSTVYVNGGWSALNPAGQEIETGKYYGLNAFSNIADSRISWSGDATGQDVRDLCVTTEAVVISAGTYLISPKTYFYSNNKADGVLIRGANPDDTATTVIFRTSADAEAVPAGRLYLTSAVSGDYSDADLAAKTGSEGDTPVYTLHKDLVLDVPMLNVGNAVDSGDSRTGGVANLEIDGTLKGCLYVAGYSDVTVNRSGNVTVLAEENREEAWLQLRPHAVLTVNGKDAGDSDDGRTFAADEYQFRQDALNFIDGGTVNLNETQAYVEYIRMDSVGEEELLDVQNDELNVTDSTLVIGQNDLTPGRADSGMAFGKTSDVSNTMTVTLTRSSLVSETKTVNPLEGMTVNVDDSTVTATAVTNSGTFNVSGVSTLNIGSLDGNAIQLLDGTTLKNTGISGGAINSGNNFTFSGTNSLTGGVSVTATGKTVTNTGAQLTVDALSAISASAVSGGVLNISTKDLSGDDLNLTETIYHVVDAALQDVVTIQLNGTSATSVEVGGATYNLFSFADRGVYLTTETQETMYVNSAYTESSCDGHLYGYNAFNSLSDALKLNLASSIVTCGDVTETAEQLSRTYSASARTYTWADKLIAEPVTKSVTISDGKKNALDETVPVNVEYRLGWPDGADLCITALQEEGATGEARTTLTIEDGVVLQFTKNTYTVVENEVEVTKTASRTGRIWLGYNWSEVYLDPNCAPGDGMEYGSIVLGCRIEDAYQTWFGCNVTLTETARVTGSGQVCFRSGASGDTEAVVTLTGEAPTGSKTTGGNNQADAMISIGTGTLEFVSGKVFTSNTYIEGGKFQISDNHWHSDCALGVESENTTWAVSGELTSGVSGYGDAILLKSGSTLDVGTTATIGGLMIMTLENGSSLNVGTVEESAGTLANSGAINVRKGTAEGAVKSELTAKTLTNKGTIGVSDGSTVTIDGAVTNGGSTILVLPVPMHGSATNNSYRTITVTLTDQTNPSKTFTTTARIYAHEFDKVFDNVQGTKTNGATVTEPGGNTLRAVVEFTDPGLVDGTYDLTVVEPETDSVGADVSLPAWTYPTEVTVRNASITLESSSEFIGGAVTNQAGATIMVNDSSDFEAASLNNYGTIVVTGTGSQLNVPSTRSGESTINTGTIQVFNGGYGSYGSILNANGTITVTDSGSEFIASSLESTSGAHVNVLNDASATVNGLFANGGTLAVENAASFHVGTLENTSSGTITITNSTVSFDTLILSASTSGNVIMDWYSTMSFTGFDGDFENKLSLDMSGYVGGTYLLLDREGTDWTEDQYKSLLTSWSTDDCDYTFVVKNGDLYVQDHYDAVYVCYDGNDSTATPTNPKFSTVAGATAVKPTAIYITGGGSGESAWKADTQSILNAIPTVISDGKFNKSVAGGIRYAGTGSKDETGPVSLHITGGDFGNLLAGGDRVETGILNRYAPKDEYDHYTASAVTLTIDDGVFRNDVACGMVIMASDFASHAYIYGDTELVINGGEFRKFVYGGSTANKIMYSAQTHIVGNVSITINAASSITMNKLVGGSHQSGKITGDILLTLKGDGSNLRFVEDGEIWGGCTGDYYSIDESGVRTYVNVGTTEGRKRTLSFDGFSGALNCSKIRAFTDVEFIGNSDVELNNGGVYSFSDISSWTFENGSSLTGNFGNDFDGDTLNLTGFGTDTTDYALITDSAPADLRNVFKGFESLNVQLDDVTVDAGSFTSRSSTLLAWAAGESSAGSWCGGSLAIVDGVMTLNLLA